MVLDAVVDDELDCRDLVVSESVVDGRSVVEFALFSLQVFLPGQLPSFRNLVFVKEGEFAVEVVVELFI